MFQVFDLDYFYLNLKKFYDKSDIVTIEKKIIYRKIYTFYRKVGDYVIIIKKEKIRNYMITCFRNNVLY